MSHCGIIIQSINSCKSRNEKKRQIVYKCELETGIQWAERHKDGPAGVQDTDCMVSGRLCVRKSVLVDRAKLSFSLVC